tara:strand:- start:242 stop:1270 length:1029 start_codon:yes stop_codon:yes gene_type:complete
MHKFLNIFNIFNFFILIVGFFLLSFGTYTHTFLKNENQINLKIKTKQNMQLSSLNKKFIDSYTINKMYSEKNIEYFDTFELKNNLNINVNIKNKPINPAIINQGIEIKLANYDIENLFENNNFKNLSNSKQNFIRTLLPLISYENQKILLEREKLNIIRESLLNQKTLTNEDLSYLNRIAKKYKIKIKNRHKIDLIEQLLISVDIIPNSIVLAQAANESGWGTSRFAKDYNALFGEYTYDFSKGVIPLQREQGKTHFVKSFSSYNNSVQSYFKNINTHYAYEKFRLIRKLMRSKNNFSKINLLVDSLETYAEDDKYVETISSIINSNKFKEFDEFIYAPSRS